MLRRQVRYGIESAAATRGVEQWPGASGTPLPCLLAPSTWFVSVVVQGLVVVVVFARVLLPAVQFAGYTCTAVQGCGAAFDVLLRFLRPSNSRGCLHEQSWFN